MYALPTIKPRILVVITVFNKHASRNLTCPNICATGSIRLRYGVLRVCKQRLFSCCFDHSKVKLYSKGVAKLATKLDECSNISVSKIPHLSDEGPPYTIAVVL